MPLQLPCGATAKNRFYKSAMNEALAGPDAAPTDDHVRVYRRWAGGGAGVLVTGNVMVDPAHLGEPGNVAVEDQRHLTMLRRWAEAGTADGTHLWMQINHPGKQSPHTINRHPVAPSTVPIAGSYGRFFDSPRALSLSEIHDLQHRFVTTASVAKQAGFTGVEIHAAHGYLINQFLSPLDNRRADEYGGGLAGRMRFLVEVYQGMREVLGADFPIAVKLNSSDGTPGGFSEEDSLQVATRLSELGVDVIDISGGTYTRPLMQGRSSEAGSGARVFFADYASKLKQLVVSPVALTGGSRSAADVDQILTTGIADLVGIARPLVLRPDFPRRVLEGDQSRVDLPRITTRVPVLDRALSAVLANNWYELQIRRLAQSKEPSTAGNTGLASLTYTLRQHGIGALLPRRAGGHA